MPAITIYQYDFAKLFSLKIAQRLKTMCVSTYSPRERAVRLPQLPAFIVQS